MTKDFKWFSFEPSAYWDCFISCKFRNKSIAINIPPAEEV